MCFGGFRAFRWVLCVWVAFVCSGRFHGFWMVPAGFMCLGGFGMFWKVLCVWASLCVSMGLCVLLEVWRASAMRLGCIENALVYIYEPFFRANRKKMMLLLLLL